MCEIKTKIVQDLTNDCITNVKYFDTNNVPLEFNYNDILQHKSNVCYCDQQIVSSINFLGVSNNGIICYTGKDSKKLVSVVIFTLSNCYFLTVITNVVL